MKTRLLMLMITFAIALANYAQQFEVDGIYYNYHSNDQTASVTRLPNNNYYKGDIHIPSAVTINGRTLPVTKIENIAFGSCKDVTSVTIDDGVIVIDQSAFERCGLKSLRLPNTLKTLGNKAFAYCTELTTVKLPESIQKWGSSCFTDCEKLTEVEVNVKFEEPLPNCLFEDQVYLWATLYVPTGMKEKYMAANGWKNFFNIVEKDFEDAALSIELKQAESSKKVYTIDGTQLKYPQNGLNIIKKSDGTSRKVLIK